MAWIESHQKLKDEPKVFDLMVALNCSKAEAIGRLHMLWWWCVDHAEDGDLRKYNDVHLALAVELNPAQASEFVSALVKAGFVDRKPYFRIANWWKYARRFMQQRYKDASTKWMRIETMYATKPRVRSGVTDPVTEPVAGTATQETNLTNQPNKQNQPNQALLVGYFCEQYGLKVGKKYVVSAKDYVNMAKLLKAKEPDEIRELIRRFFVTDDEFVRRAGYTVGVFISVINKLQDNTVKSSGTCTLTKNQVDVLNQLKNLKPAEEINAR